MPVKRRVARNRRGGWSSLHRLALASGVRVFDTFGSRHAPWPMDEARVAWADLREDILAEWQATRPTLRPWGWWAIEQEIERPRLRSEQRRYLQRHGHLTPAEESIIEADAALLEFDGYDR